MWREAEKETGTAGTGKSNGKTENREAKRGEQG